MKEAEKRVNCIINSGYFNVVNSDSVSKSAAQCKCLFPISIIDCHTLALAKEYGIPVLFYKLEKEFEPIIDELKKWVGSEILFIIK